MTAEKKRYSSALLRLLDHMRIYKWKIIAAILLIFLGVAASALAPLLLGFSINDLGLIFKGDRSEETISNFITFLALMAGCYVIYALFCFIANVLMISVTQKTIFDLREQIDAKLNRLPLNYYDTTTYGDILSRLTNDVDTISISLQSSISQIITAFFTVILTLIMMIGINGWLTLVCVLTTPVLVYISGKKSKRSQAEFDQMVDLTGEVNGYVEEYYSGHNVVAVFGKENEVDESFEDKTFKLFTASERGYYLAGTLVPISKALNLFSYVLVALVGALAAIVGGLSVGMIQAFAQYLTQFSTPISTVMQIIAIVQSVEAASGRVFEFLDEQEEVPDTPDPKFPEPLKGNVQFDHVQFGYLPHRTLINDLDVNIRAGQKVAIVGPTGAGKTTLVNLIMRFYDVKGGRILIDGVDIRDMKRNDLRKIFSMVLQDTWLFKGTIRENLRYGRLDATDDEIVAAAKKARADSFIRSLPDGYDFMLQSNGVNIAQGQRQLLTIARAMLADSPIMILDEATSSVDTRTEVLIQEAMNEMMKGKTSFVIAHRLSTIKDSDVILYMQDGDILEIGNHNELMAKDGLYAKLYNSQFEQPESGEKAE